MRIIWLHRVAAGVTLAACAGCAGDSMWGARPQGIPVAASPQSPKPAGPVKQLAAKVSESSVGKSMSSAFKLTSDKKPKPAAPSLDDPTSLNTKTKPVTADFYVSVAKIQEQAGNIEGARESYKNALSLDAQHLGALLGQARLYDRQGQLARATGLYQQAATQHPTEAAAFNDLGLCYARQKMFVEAADALNRAIALQPDRTLYRNNIATILVELGRIDEATEHLTLVHGNVVAHYNVGYLLHRRGQTREAIEQFQRSAEADPNFSDAQEWIESLSAELADAGAAIESLPPTVDDQQAPDGPALSSQDDEVAEEIPLGVPESPHADQQAADDDAPTGNYYRSPRAQTVPLRGSPDDDNGSATAISSQDDDEAPIEMLPPVAPQQIPPSRY